MAQIMLIHFLDPAFKSESVKKDIQYFIFTCLPKEVPQTWSLVDCRLSTKTQPVKEKFHHLHLNRARGGLRVPWGTLALLDQL